METELKLFSDIKLEYEDIKCQSCDGSVEHINVKQEDDTKSEIVILTEELDIKHEINENELVESYEKNRIKVQKCSICSYYTTEQRLWDLHHHYVHLKENGWKPSPQIFTCIHVECPFETIHVDSLNNHLNKKHSKIVSWYKCSRCKFQTKYRGLFHNHEITVHAMLQKPTNVIVKRFSMLKFSHQCEYCKCKFKTEMHLQRHVTNLHVAVESGYYRCPNCIFKTKVKSWWRQHMKNLHFMKIVDEMMPQVSLSNVSFDLFDKFLSKYEKSLLYSYNVKKKQVGRSCMSCPICSDLLGDVTKFKIHIYQQHITSNETVELLKKYKPHQTIVLKKRNSTSKICNLKKK